MRGSVHLRDVVSAGSTRQTRKEQSAPRRQHRRTTPPKPVFGPKNAEGLAPQLPKLPFAGLVSPFPRPVLLLLSIVVSSSLILDCLDVALERRTRTAPSYRGRSPFRRGEVRLVHLLAVSIRKVDDPDADPPQPRRRRAERAPPIQSRGGSSPRTRSVVARARGRQLLPPCSAAARTRGRARPAAGPRGPARAQRETPCGGGGERVQKPARARLVRRGAGR